eukprot:5579342-Amphidinium_carterae.1
MHKALAFHLEEIGVFQALKLKQAMPLNTHCSTTTSAKGSHNVTCHISVSSARLPRAEQTHDTQTVTD